MKDSSKTNRDLIEENSALKKRIRELEQTSSEKIREENELRVRQLTVLHETSVELTAELNLDALLHSIARRALNLIGGAACNCYLYNPQTDLLERVVSAGKALVPSPKTRQRGEGMVGQVWVKGTPLLVNDYASWSGRTKAYDSFPSRALVAAPFRWGTEILGVLNIMALLPHQYTQMDVEMLSLFAAQAAIAIRNVRLHDRMKMELADRRRAEEALESERSLLRNLIDNVPDRIYAKDSEGRFIICNEAMIRRMGMTSMTELVGKSDFDFLPPEMAQRFRTDEQAVIQSGKSMINREEPLATEGGTITRWNLATKVPLLDKQGNRIGVVGVGREITDRKQAEEAVRWSEIQLHAILESTADGILAADNKGRVIKTNRRFADLWRVPQSLMDAGDDRALLDFVTNQLSDPDAFLKKVRLLYDSDTVDEDTLAFKDGRVFERFSFPMIMEGVIIGRVWSFRDITERKRMEEALRESQAFYHSLVEQLPAGVFRKDREGRYVFVSPWFCRLKGMQEEEFLCKTPQEVAASEAAKSDATQQAIKYAAGGADHHLLIMQTGNPIELVEEYTDAAGRKQFVHVIKIPVFNSEGKVIGTQGVLFDITERKRTEQEIDTLADVGRIISSTPDIDEVYERFAETVRKIVPFDRIVINIIDVDMNTVTNVYMAGHEIADRKVGVSYPLKGSGNFEMVRTKSSLLIQTEDFDEYKDRFPMLLSTFQAGFRSIMNIPFFSKGEIAGGLLLRSFKPYAYTDHDVRLAERVGNQIAGAIANAQLVIGLKKTEQELKESEQRYRELSIIDDLTQLYNSRHFYFQLKIELDRSNRYEQPLTLLLLDLDNFKAFNDAYGHVEGDQVLKRLGQVVKKCLRETDFAYRYGGEEFTIMLPMTTSADGAVTAERIRTEFKKETFSPAPGQDVHSTVSIGLAQYKPQEEMKAFVHRVDQLMYQGKKNGKDRVCSES
jgi:diguanylate cyclase (GGDEF)-like protein/PAS domain S-box-containing protein